MRRKALEIISIVSRLAPLTLMTPLTRVAPLMLKAPLTLMALLAMGTLGCQDDFTPASLINKPRLLGVQVRVQGDAQRATPVSGEQLDVSILVAGPEGSYTPATLSSMVIECTYPDRFTGIPICQEFLDLAELSSEELEKMFGVPSLGSAAVPSQLGCEGPSRTRSAGVTLSCIDGVPNFAVRTNNIASGRDVLLRGVVCTEGTASFDATAPSLFSCVDGSAEHTHAFHNRITIAESKSSENHNPDLGLIAAEINGQPFDFDRHSVAEAGQAGQAGDATTSCSNDAASTTGFALDPYEHTISFRVPKEARQRLPQGGRETLEFSVFASHGEVDRRFTFFSDDDVNGDELDSNGVLTKSVTWTALDTVDDGESQWVDFWITVRDQRGGFASLRRSACVMLPEPF